MFFHALPEFLVVAVTAGVTVWRGASASNRLLEHDVAHDTALPSELEFAELFSIVDQIT